MQSQSRWNPLMAVRRTLYLGAPAALTHVGETRPDFLSYHVNDLPHAAVTLFRLAFAGPVVSWTVRTPAQRELAERWADQMVFEGFRP